MKKSRFHFLKSPWFIGIIIIIIVIVVFVWVRGSSKPSSFETATAQIGTVIEQVSVTGTVMPVDESQLSFEKGGVISNVYITVGQMVKAGDPIASLDSADDQSNLASEEATLADMTRSLTPQELAVQETAVTNAQSDALNAAHTAYVDAQSALFNYTDSFFTNPQSSNPLINIHTDSTVTQNNLDNERVAVSTALNNWSNELGNASSSNAEELLADSQTYLSSIKSFMNDLAVTVNELNPGNSSLSQMAITADVATMNSGLSTLNGGIDAVSSAQSELTTAESNYNLKLSGNSAQSIAAEAAKVAGDKAVLAEDTLISPIDGIVTQADPTVGEYVAPGSSGFTIEDSNFKIEAYVPEADIAKVAVGDLASTTLDAYGSFTDFPSQVTMIDPAETVLEGVPTYKVTLYFVTPDSRIRSGMTANLEILTHEAVGVLEIPYRAVTITATSSTVRLLSSDGKSYATVPIVTGLKGSDGTVQIISGLNQGDQVVTYVKS